MRQKRLVNVVKNTHVGTFLNLITNACHSTTLDVKEIKIASFLWANVKRVVRRILVSLTQ